ncbi:DUF4339 domain-containing protein [Flaviaesturariibacter aridisoli]|uniref:DUF4339 domain-containing protein n=1 Tax=Flaviaesturariibacter aridisoli TaxID=2545761 RepID=A0A4R4DZX1_9BACT|nr:DUF4339 domain-containing protein [Flaviaesturariibacter aridisoli]TCZ67057.1 DUF4339 domain-containing protein [Flaviaesturariibacter aridisoli]
MATYFLQQDGRQTGPFTLDELIALPITTDTWVWTEGMIAWQRAGDVYDLKLLFRTVPPPFVAPAPPPLEAKAADETKYPEYPEEPRRKRRGWWWGIGSVAAIVLLFVVYQSNSGSALVQSAFTSERNLKRELRVNWNQYLAATNSEYQYREFGGIFNLKVIFANNSDYMMNEMTASVTYIKSNGGVWQVLPVKIFNVPPHTTITHPVDDVHRCTSVDVKLTGAVSREAELSMINGYDSGEPGDPYHMH